jgi:hypothetical protein
MALEYFKALSRLEELLMVVIRDGRFGYQFGRLPIGCLLHQTLEKMIEFEKSPAPVEGTTCEAVYFSYIPFDTVRCFRSIGRPDPTQIPDLNDC